MTFRRKSKNISQWHNIVDVKLSTNIRRQPWRTWHFDSLKRPSQNKHNPRPQASPLREACPPPTLVMDHEKLHSRDLDKSVADGGKVRDGPKFEVASTS